MRNILEYPITKDEIIQTLKMMGDEEMALEICGNTRPLILEKVIKIVEQYEGPEIPSPGRGQDNTR